MGNSHCNSNSLFILLGLGYPVPGGKPQRYERMQITLGITQSPIGLYQE